MLKETPSPLFRISKSGWGSANTAAESNNIIAKAVRQEKKKRERDANIRKEDSECLDLYELIYMTF